MSCLDPKASAFVPSRIKLNAAVKDFVPQALKFVHTQSLNDEAARFVPRASKYLGLQGFITAEELYNPIAAPEEPPAPKAYKSPKTSFSNGALKPDTLSPLQQPSAPLAPIPSKVPPQIAMASNTLPNAPRALVPMYTKRLNDHQIRLLVILPGEGDSQIICNLVVYETDKLPAYEALSYVWGTSTRLEPILCDGHCVNVTPNLLFALKQLRYKNKKRVLWIDSICINQGHKDEKAEQVQMMKNIYSEASRVVVSITCTDENWLCDPGKTIEALELMEQLRGAGESIWSALTWSAEDFEESELEKVARKVGKNRKKMKNFLNFIRSAWFTRIWCVQEIVLAQDAVMLLGCNPPSEIPWERIMPLIPWLLEQEVDVRQLWGEEVHKAVRSIYDTLSTTRYSLDVDVRGLLHALSDFRHRKATDPRDKVYALLGLIDWRYNTSSLIPNYDKSIYDVYFDAAKSIIETTGDLALLAAAQSTDLGHPSWVPLWDEDSPSLDVRLLNLWSACGDQKGGNPVKITQDMLHVVGRKFDTVDHAGESLEPDRNGEIFQYSFEDIEDATRQILELWLKIHQEDPLKSPDRESQIRIMAITLIQGLMDDQQPVYENTESALNMEFLTFMKSLLWKCNYTLKLDPDYGRTYDSISKEWNDPGYKSAMDFRRKVFYGWYRRYEDDSSIPKVLNFTETHYARLASIRLLGRRIFYTSEGYFGNGPGSMQKNDIIVVLNGATIPYVLRPVNTRNEYKLVGSCYIHDIMDGKWYNSSSNKREIFGLR